MINYYPNIHPLSIIIMNDKEMWVSGQVNFNAVCKPDVEFTNAGNCPHTIQSFQKQIDKHVLITISFHLKISDA